ncbi:MAG: D-2-hydroxyacid dehydrogenase [Chitinophagaceae bacterium]|nr:MAG: D-2-hydroxyacid dehydrogenase [Chitinophagaceae bacterium]
MKIVVADGYALNSGDLSWKSIEQLGELTVYDRTSPSQLIERCKEADIIVSNKTPVGKEAIENLPNLKMITMLATGYNVIDVSAAKAKGITVCNVPAYGTDSVAQHAFALILALANQVHVHAASVAKGEWQRSPDFGYALTPLTELAGKTLGIVGMGNIGRQTAKIGEAFGMNILYNSRSEKKGVSGKYVNLQELFAQSDFISLHCPLTDENFEFVNASLIRLMKRTACIINTARGQLVNEQDLADALNNGTIAGAGLDVLSKEPPGDNPLITAKNCVITPHNAWMTKEARERIMEETKRNIRSFIERVPRNVVNG